jgi:hypothetical protein
MQVRSRSLLRCVIKTALFATNLHKADFRMLPGTERANRWYSTQLAMGHTLPTMWTYSTVTQVVTFLPTWRVDDDPDRLRDLAHA